MTERHEEQAALNALYALDAHERQILRAELRTDPRLRDLEADFEDAAAQLVLLMPCETPPAELKDLLLKTIKDRPRVSVTPLGASFRFLLDPRIAWAAAACLALIAWSGYSSRNRLSKEISETSRDAAEARAETAMAREKLTGLEKARLVAAEKADQLAGEIATLKEANAFARAEITNLRATVRRFDEGSAVVVWDAERQEGRLRIEKMPPVPANKDYQLWVIDKTTSTPVSAGVIKIDAKGVASMAFRTVEPVPVAAKFAISIEALGGVPKKSGDGPIVFAGP